MKAIVLGFVLTIYFPICIGRHVKALHAYNYVHKPRLSMRDHGLLDEGRPSEKPTSPVVCEDDPNYADGCPEKAAVENYCRDQRTFMRKYCAKSCNFCTEAATARPTTATARPTTEAEKPPAPIVCEDDPNYADGCPEKAAVKNYCRDQKSFMRKYCAKSCGFCTSTTSPTEEPMKPGEVGCADNPQFKDQCVDIASKPGFCKEQEDFTRKNCKSSCGWCDSPATKPPIQETFCRDRDRNCAWWKSFGLCENPGRNSSMAVYCGVTCGFCKAPTPEECYDKGNNCQELKRAGHCKSTRPDMEYEVKTNCLQTCEFCVPDRGP
ncbi:zinc metalloproteinase nas-15-like isoform X5 [Stylophora pistillata]|uniref:zinc metalloproteinase nas-15-like isoform X5 n=1 Tax=Stylophora pistillata TaxID=50429 RepID=UPI000C04AB5C|nr:zinc metalloproteinase nas-15-like isoform X5 [Stylophora pistillata]